jgi:uncharacterized protein
MFGSYGLYLLISLPALLFGLWAQLKVKSAFNKYSRVRSMIGLSGAQIARRMLDSNGLTNVKIEMASGFLSDHYDPRTKVLRLSPDVYQNPSLASAGIAAHEAGHALQDAASYVPLKIRSSMVPTVQIGSWLGPIIFMLGLIMASPIGIRLAWVGLMVFAATALFAIITLPVEFNATKRAKAWLSTSGVIYTQEAEGINSVLDAAAMTYVAAALQAVSTIVYYLALLSGGRRR